MSSPARQEPDPYVPDYRLRETYAEANNLDDAGLEALCPSYLELAENELRYRDEVLLGEGGLKEVFKTWDARSKRWLATARLREDRGPEFYDQFVHEAWLTSSLSHPNIINVYDVGVDSYGRPFFTMDLKGTTTLEDLIKNRGMRDRRELLAVFLKICDAVAYAHSRRIIHLDLKPENIQADRFGEVLVCDWGLGKSLAATDPEDAPPDLVGRPEALDNMTLHGQIKGTLGFMAPEQVEAGAEKDERTDLFALGCLLHTILAGVPPLTGRNSEELLESTRTATFPPPRLRYPHRMIPESLEAVIMKACSREPGERYGSAADLQGEVRNFLTGYATQAERPNLLRAAGRILARHRSAALISLAALIALLTAGAFFLHGLERQREATAEEHRRATQFASKADDMSTLYEDTLDQSRQSKVALAEKLAASANSLKNLGIFKAPGRSVREALALAGLAHKLDPKNEEARYELFALRCIQLDFQSALRTPPVRGHRFAHYPDFAWAFPKFAYTQKSRPSPNDLAAFFRRAREINAECGPLMERILSYDHAVRRTPAGPEPVVALLEYLNGGPNHLVCDHQAKDRSFFLWSNRGSIKLRQPVGSGSGKCILDYLPIASLTVETSGQLDLSELEGLRIESLDLTRCRAIKVGKSVNLPNLREVRIGPAFPSPEPLRRAIRTNERLSFLKDPASD